MDVAAEFSVAAVVAAAAATDVDSFLSFDFISLMCNSFEFALCYSSSSGVFAVAN